MTPPPDEGYIAVEKGEAVVEVCPPVSACPNQLVAAGLDMCRFTRQSQLQASAVGGAFNKTKAAL